MELIAFELIKTLGPYALVILFTVTLYRVMLRHREEISQLHAKTLDAFDRHTASYERVHYDLVSLKRTGETDKAISEVDAHHKKAR